MEFLSQQRGASIGDAYNVVMGMTLKIVQAGDPVLGRWLGPLSRTRSAARRSSSLIELMRETMRDAPGVGLAAPQIGESIRLVVIEDRAEYQQGIAPERLAERERVPVPFHVIANPVLTVLDEAAAPLLRGLS